MSNRVDAHCHLWTVARGDYGWLDANNVSLAPIFRDFDMADMRAADTNGEGWSRVIVQAAPSVDETRFLLGLADANHDISGVVGWVDLSKSDADETLENLSNHAAFKGVRPMLQDIVEVDWINTQPRADAIAALKRLNLTFDALVLPKHLSQLLKFSTVHSELSIVIDHGAKPPLSAEASDPRHAMWRDGMAQMAAETSSVCKISGLLTELTPDQRPHAKEILRPIVDQLLEWFGPERLMWGSDWPVVNLAASFDTWHALSEDLLSQISLADRSRIYSGTARSFYGLGEPA